MTVEYTKQWVRIMDSLRPLTYLGLTVAAGGLVWVAVFLATSNMPAALISGGIAVIVGAIISLMIMRLRKEISVNLGERKVRFHTRTYNFSDIESVSTTPQRLVLHARDGEELRVPVSWVSKDQLRVLHRMLRMLDNEKVRTGAMQIIQDQVEELSR